MKQLIVFYLIFFVHQAFTQSKKDIFRLRVQFRDNHSIAGYLRSVTDSTIILSSNQLETVTVETISLSEILLIKIRSKKRATTGVIAGALVGSLVGFTIAFMSYEEPPPQMGIYYDSGPEGDGIVGAVVVGTAGALTGFAIRNSPIKIDVQKAKVSGDNIKTQLEKYVLQPK